MNANIFILNLALVSLVFVALALFAYLLGKYLEKRYLENSEFFNNDFEKIDSSIFNIQVAINLTDNNEQKKLLKEALRNMNSIKLEISIRK